jgi:hypothetical protein
MKRVTDEAGYREKEQRQMRPGVYHVHASELLPNSRALLPNDPRIRPQITGSIESSTKIPVSAESDLRGLGRPTNRAPVNFSSTNEHLGHHKMNSDTAEGTSQIRTRDIVYLRTLDTRLDMPALALRGATPNRFHPHLLRNPADFAFAPFDRLVSSRIVMKDQWRVPASSLTSVRPPTIPANVQNKPAY